MDIPQMHSKLTKTNYFVLMYSIIVSLICVSCKQKADINKLFNETEKRLELNFKYIRVSEGTFSGMSDGELYHVDYDKINQLIHVFSSRSAYIQIDEIYFVNINKFQCTETQICFQNDEVRITIENADEYYIVHIYEKSVSGINVKWNKYATLFNSKQSPYGLNESIGNTSENVIYEKNEGSNNEGKNNISTSEDLKDFYNPDDIEQKAQNFLSKYKNESKSKAILGYPTDTQIIRLFPVSIVNTKDDSHVFKISFSNYDFENKKEELGITEDLPLSGLYVVYEEKLFDCSDLEINKNGTAYYICRPHEIWKDI